MISGSCYWSERSDTFGRGDVNLLVSTCRLDAHGWLVLRLSAVMLGFNRVPVNAVNMTCAAILPNGNNW
ncbi:hypothetical protein J6590_078870 [Homalodisca vitripennis]|nr:hypothetical protein J6590_078870 [Homalodisca vitripennis]